MDPLSLYGTFGVCGRAKELAIWRGALVNGNHGDESSGCDAGRRASDVEIETAALERRSESVGAIGSGRHVAGPLLHDRAGTHPSDSGGACGIGRGPRGFVELALSTGRENRGVRVDRRKEKHMAKGKAPQRGG